MNVRWRRWACLLGLLLGGTAAAQSAAEAGRLNVSIPVFSAGVPDDSLALAELGIFPRIRDIEAQYLPYELRRQLSATGHWGAVRVVSDADVIEELVVHGEILESDGRQLAIRVRATDATGTDWFDETFAAPLEGPSETPAYVRLFAEVVARLEAALSALPVDAPTRLHDVALLRYGARLAPKTFGPYLEEEADGGVRIRRLPARDDPMVNRITRVREAEYVIIDQADARYEQLFGDVEAIYRAWRTYNRKSLTYAAEDARRIAESEPPGPRGSYEALLHAYENYKFSRLTDEERDDMAVAFDNEVRPIVRRLDERLADYAVWRETRYREWNRLLEELNEIETRLAD